MKRTVFPILRPWLRRLVAAGSVVMLAPLTLADTTRSQAIALTRGWNAVFLEVEPADNTPSAWFTGTPVDVVASFHPNASSAQFMSNPNAEVYRKQGWGVWYADNRPDRFLRSLHALQAQQGYLIHAKTDYTLTITGTVRPAAIRWLPNEYNFVGFSVNTPGGPTFAQFFRGSAAHQHNKIYRLTDGNWRRVLDPGAESMRAGEAFWVYCQGSSKYQGPLAIDAPSSEGLLVGEAGGTLVMRNLTDHPLTPTVEHVPAGTNAVPLSIKIQLVGSDESAVETYSAAKPVTGWTQSLPPLESGAGLSMPFAVRREEMQASVHSSLLKIKTDLGTVAWLPIISTRKDLEEQ